MKFFGVLPLSDAQEKEVNQIREEREQLINTLTDLVDNRSFQKQINKTKG